MDTIDLEIQIKEKELIILQEQLELLKLRKLHMSKIGNPSYLEALPIQQGGKTSGHSEENKEAPRLEERSHDLNHEKEGTDSKVYVVYNGPNPGIYSSWPEASKAIQGTPGLVHRSFKNRIEAEGSFAEYKRPKLLKPTEVISKLVLKQEQESFLSKLTRSQDEGSSGSSKLVRLGTIPQPPVFKTTEQEREELKKIRPDQWFYLSNLIRKNTELKEEGICSSDRRYPEFIHSKYNVYSGVDPKLIYQIFFAGLLDNLYPGETLEELKYFPDHFQKAVRNFKKIARSGNRPIFLRFNSSILDWGERQEEKYPYHIIRIGLMSPEKNQEKGIVQPVRDVDPNVLHLERAYTLNNIYRELRKISKESEVKVNYFTSKIMMLSHKNKKLTEEDAEKVIRFESRFNSNELDVSPTTQKLFCLLAKEVKDHQCVICARTEEEEKVVQPLLSDDEEATDNTYLDSSE